MLQDAGYRMQDAGYWMQDTRCKKITVAVRKKDRLPTL